MSDTHVVELKRIHANAAGFLRVCSVPRCQKVLVRMKGFRDPVPRIPHQRNMQWICTVVQMHEQLRQGMRELLRNGRRRGCDLHPDQELVVFVLDVVPQSRPVVLKGEKNPILNPHLFFFGWVRVFKWGI